MLVTLFGISILVKPLHPQKAYEPILVTLSGIVTLVKPLQYWKAYEPILVTSPLKVIVPLPSENS